MAHLPSHVHICKISFIRFYILSCFKQWDLHNAGLEWLKILCYSLLNIYAFYAKRFYTNTHSGANMYMCTRVVYMRVCVPTGMCVHMGTRMDLVICAYMCLCRRVRVCHFSWHFNPSSVFLYIIYIAHCSIILLCTLMLYISDRPTPDLNKDDELNISLKDRCSSYASNYLHTYAHKQAELYS